MEPIPTKKKMGRPSLGLSAEEKRKKRASYMREFRKKAKESGSTELANLTSQVHLLQELVSNLEEEVKSLEASLEEEIKSKRLLSRRLQEAMMQIFQLERDLFQLRSSKQVHFDPSLDEVDEVDEFEVTSSTSPISSTRRERSLPAKRTRSGANFGKKKKQVVPSRVEDMEEEEERFESETLGELLQDPRYRPHRASQRLPQPPDRLGSLFNYE
jgi:chromosome segregation ATPase